MSLETFGTVFLVCFACIAVAGTALLFLIILRSMWKVIRKWNRSSPTDLW